MGREPLFPHCGTERRYDHFRRRKHLSCSDRTVRNTLKLIDQTMNVQGVKLISKQGQGYQLFFENQEAYQEFRLTYELGEVYSTTSISKGI